MELPFDPFYLALAGIFVIILVLFRQLGQRARQNAEKQSQREAALRAAQDAERKSQVQTNIPKSKVILPQTRLPIGDSLGTPFTGALRGSAAKWEAEIHKIGRQIIGQIDSKMAALQAITLDANRTANRLEILAEHLEQIAQKQIEQQQSQALQKSQALQSSADESVSVEESSGVIPAASVSDAVPLADMLKEITEDLEDVRNTIKQSTTFTEQPELATILRLPAELKAEPSVADPALNLRGEVEMLANYGLQPQEIAQRLEISIGEIDLILQVQQNRPHWAT